VSVPDVFAPAQLGPITLRNRVVKAATFEGRAPGALVSDSLIDFHTELARGGVGMTTVAYQAVSPEGRTHADQVYLRPEALPGLRKLVDAVHAEGAAVQAQVGHAGPVANGRSNGVKALAASGLPSPMSMQWIRKARPDDMDRLVKDYVAGVELLIEAGFDSLEMHLGHGYLLSSFLSPNTNRRKDEFGGSLENRAKFPLRVMRAVREAVNGRVAVTAKISMSDGAPGGFRPKESIPFAKMLQDEDLIDALQLSAGSSLMNPMYLFRGDAPVKEFAATMPQPLRMGIRMMGTKFLKAYPFEEAFLRPMAREFREALDLPLMLLGGINEKATMDEAMTEGFEFVVMGRALLREPDLINRLRSGEATGGICIHCNRCMPTIYSGTNCPIKENA
jgi:2,4-dienoyl-CoA reductase-like NADH-dependent reductase (Old Yellow Enzyme family)